MESANKLVVEARLKGSGMHWPRPNVNPMLALRTVVCSDRWREVWPLIAPRLCQQRTSRPSRRPRPVAPTTAAAQATTLPAPTSLQPLAAASTGAAPATAVAHRSPMVVNGRPTKDHPWKQPVVPNRRDGVRSSHAKS